MKASTSTKTEKKHVNLSHLLRFYSLFSSIAMVWCIRNFCYKDVESLRNTTLNLYVDCMKQFFRNSQNCGKIKHGFCNIITQQITHKCLCVSFWPKTKPPYSPDLPPADFFPFPKLKILIKGGKRVATIEDMKEKLKQKLSIDRRYQKAPLRSVSGIGKSLT